MRRELAIECVGLGKAYLMGQSPWQRLLHQLRGRSSAPVHWALRGVNLEVPRGSVVGVVGRNGAGKSTLLQLLCGTLTPTTGSVTVSGRVAALLELGAGFNPHFTGRENALLNAALLGLSDTEARERLGSMLAFADIGAFADQPVRTYSSGMFMRLAFAVATSVDPDILVIDEALSVGDGAFARKSFERIMDLKARGATILFCSHSMYQVEALCESALWLDSGNVRMQGSASDVCGAYQAHLNGLDRPGWDVAQGGAAAWAPAGMSGKMDSPAAGGAAEAAPDGGGLNLNPSAPAGTARLTGFSARLATGTEAASTDGTIEASATVHVRSGVDDVELLWRFASDPALPTPCVALGISDQNGQTVSSALSLIDGATVHRLADGSGHARLVLPRLPLLKGRYSLTAFLLSEDGLHPYDQVIQAAQLVVEQDGPLQGLVSLPRRWM